MIQSVVAQRYAKAIFEIALKRKKIDEIGEELQHIKKSFAASSELRNWLSYPFIEVDDKKVLLGNIFNDVSEPVQNLLFLLVDRYRTDQIERIAEAYQQLQDDHKGMVQATVTTAFPLTAEEEKQLISTFEHLTQKKLRIEKQVDSDLLGGVIVKIGDRLYDGSLRTKLQRFRKSLANAKVDGLG